MRGEHSGRQGTWLRLLLFGLLYTAAALLYVLTFSGRKL
jgi:hypothetical protein